MSNVIANSAMNDSSSLQPTQSLQDNTPRLIAADDGHILFANNEFLNLCHMQSSIQNVFVQDLFKFLPEYLENGYHHVKLRNCDKEVSLQFDWVEMHAEQKYLVISVQEQKQETTAREKLLAYVASKVAEKENAIADQTPFLDISFDACSITDFQGRFTNINHTFTKLFGFTEEELNGKILTDLVHPDSRQEFQNALSTLMVDESAFLEICCISKDGLPLWIEWNHKKVGENIYSSGRDLTPLKGYRDSLERQHRKLMEAEAIGQIGQWHWPVGSENIEFSDQLFKIFDVDENDFQPTLDSVSGLIHNQDADRMMQVFQRAVIEQNDYDMDFRIIRNNGETRYIRCEGRCELDKDDDVVALYGIMQDVTDTMKRETDLRQAKESVERAYAAKTQFLANMSHELRTPLNAIIGFSEMMERQLLGPIGTEKYLEYISGIRESGEHLLDLISDILDMSKIEAGKYELHLEQFNIAKVIRMAAHMMEGRALDSDIKINIDIQNEELNIHADRRATMQMILNLLSNAVKFSKQGKSVNISMVEKENSLNLHIKDEGIGIPANKLANIMMPFEQAETDYTREYEGTGLGLAITKELAEIHGGDVMIESTLGVGTEVIIILPYEAKR